MVDDRISQDSVEPCNRALRLPQLTSVLNGSHIGCLQDVFSRCRITHPATQELQEPAVHPHQAGYCFVISCQLRRDHGPSGSCNFFGSAAQVRAAKAGFYVFSAIACGWAGARGTSAEWSTL